MTTAEDFFNRCVDLYEQRGAVYSPESGAPAMFEQSAQMTHALLEKFYGPLPALPGYMQALLMVSLKTIRAAQESSQEDTFLDGAVYFFLSWEAKMQNAEEKPEIKFSQEMSLSEEEIAQTLGRCPEHFKDGKKLLQCTLTTGHAGMHDMGFVPKSRVKRMLAADHKREVKKLRKEAEKALNETTP